MAVLLRSASFFGVCLGKLMFACDIDRMRRLRACEKLLLRNSENLRPMLAAEFIAKVHNKITGP